MKKFNIGDKVFIKEVGELAEIIHIDLKCNDVNIEYEDGCFDTIGIEFLDI